MKNIVLIHGWGANVSKLQPLKKELERFKWNVFVPKLPGFGSPPPDTIWGVSDYANYIANLSFAKFKKKKYFVFGHSFGGRIGIKLETEVSKDLNGVILCSISGISRGNLVKRVIFALLAKGGRVVLNLSPISQSYRKFLYKLAREHDYEKAEGIMKDIFKKIISEDLKPFVSKIRMPTLILWGKKDKLTSVKDAYFLKAKIKGAQLTVFSKEGHRLPYNKPKKVAFEIEKWYKNLK